MRIDELLSRGAPTFSFEFFPPRTPEGEANLYAALRELRELDPAYVSVTYGAGGSTRRKTLDCPRRTREEYGREARAHSPCVGATGARLRQPLDERASTGQDNVLARRGAPPQGEDQWVKTEGGLEFSSQLV